ISAILARLKPTTNPPLLTDNPQYRYRTPSRGTSVNVEPSSAHPITDASEKTERQFEDSLPPIVPAPKKRKVAFNLPPDEGREVAVFELAVTGKPAGNDPVSPFTSKIGGYASSSAGCLSGATEQMGQTIFTPLSPQPERPQPNLYYCDTRNTPQTSYNAITCTPCSSNKDHITQTHDITTRLNAPNPPSKPSTSRKRKNTETTSSPLNATTIPALAYTSPHHNSKPHTAEPLPSTSTARNPTTSTTTSANPPHLNTNTPTPTPTTLLSLRHITPIAAPNKKLTPRQSKRRSEIALRTGLPLDSIAAVCSSCGQGGWKHGAACVVRTFYEGDEKRVESSSSSKGNGGGGRDGLAFGSGGSVEREGAGDGDGDIVRRVVKRRRRKNKRVRAKKEEENEAFAFVAGAGEGGFEEGGT
ncbi:MAG: hypothetical protein Q9164_003829, partial [Protoblastenia rupestris]